jgi:hypothetical protein
MSVAHLTQGVLHVLPISNLQNSRVSSCFLVYLSIVLLASCFTFSSRGLPSVCGIFQLTCCCCTKVSNATRNIAEWAAELAEFELDFLPRHAVKSHVKEPEVKTPIFTKPHWTFFFNGSSCKQGARVGVLLLTPSG